MAMLHTVQNILLDQIYAQFFVLLGRTAISNVAWRCVQVRFRINRILNLRTQHRFLLRILLVTVLLRLILLKHRFPQFVIVLLFVICPNIFFFEFFLFHLSKLFNFIGKVFVISLFFELFQEAVITQVPHENFIFRELRNQKLDNNSLSVTLREVIVLIS